MLEDLQKVCFLFMLIPRYWDLDDCVVGFVPVFFAMRAYKHHLPDYYFFSFSSWTSHLVSYKPFSFLFAVFTLSRCERTETAEQIRTDKDRNCGTNPE